MSAPDSLRRTQVAVHPDEQTEEYEGGRIRVYFDPMGHDDSETTDSDAHNESETPPAPSVSVIKRLREDPEKAEILEGWRNRYDGQSSWARPWYKDQMVFKGHRGTIIHFVILDELGQLGGDDYYTQVGPKHYGREEYEAEYALKQWSKKAPSANSEAVPYTPRANQYDGEHAWDRAMRGARWAARAFHEHMIENGPLTTSRANVLGVEQYVWDREYGYGGQYDLLYRDPDGTVVLSDLKTSSGIRFDHKLQSAAYKRAVDSDPQAPDVDCTEIIRLDPDDEAVVIERSTEWDRTLDGLAHEFLGLADKAQVTFQQTLTQAREQLTATDGATASTGHAGTNSDSDSETETEFESEPVDQEDTAPV